jgi:hypothetical protein
MNMKRKIGIILGIAGILVFHITCNGTKKSVADSNSDATVITPSKGNSVFYESEVVKMKTGTITVKGEVKNPGPVDFGKLYKHEIVMREAVINGSDEVRFNGAFRYIGYSLLDILQSFIISKKNEAAFKPQIDLYIVIENDKGESIVFSWSEIFHTSNLHQVLIATESAPIKPHKAEVNYEIGDTWKVVAGNDLYSYRILDNPTSITIYSFDKKEFPIDKSMGAMMYSPNVKLIIDDKVVMTIPAIEDESRFICYNTVHYGMGMGYHENTVFKGLSLIPLMKENINIFDKDKIRNGLICFASIDGYRSVFSFSELFNRCDQAFPILAVPKNPKNGGYYRIFLPSDFFADRSVKSLKEMYFFMAP